MFSLLGCNEKPKAEHLNAGIWRAALRVQDQKELPFTFNLEQKEGNYLMTIRNAEERITVDEITIEGDSLTIKLPVFEGYIAGTFDGIKIQGNFIKESLDHVVPFQAKFGESERFPGRDKATSNISGIWETVFYPEENEPYLAKGFFKQNEKYVTGTFRTATGDYRYLEGVVAGDSLMLSTFDGAHAFLFTAGIKDSTLTGKFYSGNHSLETFTAKRNENFELPDANTLTFLKEGYERFRFAFPDSEGKIISSDAPAFIGKVVIVQIMGTWCPNCLDETKFLLNYLKENDHPDLKVIALGFEKHGEAENIQLLKDFKERLEIPYEVLSAGSPKKSAEALPMLNHIMSYPTLIIIDKQDQVRTIHTGFAGPATSEYKNFEQNFSETVKALLEE